MQGAEVMALKGAPHALEGVEVILTEVREAPLGPPQHSVAALLPECVGQLASFGPT